MLIAASAVAAAAATTHSASAVVTSWTAGNGTWHVASNWSNGVPNVGFDAVFNRLATYQVSFTASGHADALLAQRGDVTFAHAAGAGSVTVSSGSLQVGAGTGQLATLRMSGGAGTFLGDALVGANGGAGTLLFANGWRVASASFWSVGEEGGGGTLAVSGAGTAIDVTSIDLGSGFEANSTGTLLVSGGALVRARTEGITIGHAGNTGFAHVSGPGSRLQSDNAIALGSAPFGTSGTATGTLNVTGGATAAAQFGVFVGFGPASAGVSVDAGTLSTGSLGLVVGNGNGEFMVNAATATFANGSRLTTSSATAGLNQGQGVIRFTGAGNTWTNSGNLFIGFNFGRGTVDLAGVAWTNGGNVNVGTTAAVVQVSNLTVRGGTAANINGTLIVNNTGTVNYNGGSLGAAAVNLSGGHLVFSAGRDKALVTRSIAASGGGYADLADNAIVVDYTAASPLAAVRGLIVTGFNAGGWNGGGINSATAAATPGTGVGYAEASALFTSFPATFFGVTVDNTAIVAAYARYGDANLDGIVNLQDFNRLAASFGASGGALWSQGDFNYDGNVNLQDFNLLAANFGLSASGPGVSPGDWAALGAAVPEPSSLGVLMLAGAARVARRRGRR